MVLLGATSLARSQGTARITDLDQLLADPRVVSPEELRAQTIQGLGRLHVIVGLHQTSEMENFMGWREPRRARARRAEIQAYQHSALDLLPPAEFSLRHRLENQPSFSGEITIAGLSSLLANPDVATVEPDSEAKMQTDQGITLMNGDGARAQFSGTGMSIAIVDTGIDYNHVALGGGGFPNGKVIGGRDLGDNDGNPLDQNGHGTLVAGVAAGDVIMSGNYVGGVAPGARLYALKIVAGGNDFALFSTMAAAWDWCVTHQDDDPSNPILVINLSFGGGLHSSICNGSYPTLATAATNATNAGMAIFCAAGNDGSCNSISSPACLSRTISVGGVYDASLGGFAWCVDPSSCVGQSPSGCTSNFHCSDTGTVADRVTCYSNSASILDILAPSSEATVPLRGGGYGGFHGTSAASPYAAGAAAVLIHAARSYGWSLSYAEVRDKLVTSGTGRTDPKSGLTKPRVDLGGAVNALGTWVDFAYNGQEAGTQGMPFNTLQEGLDGSPGGGARLFVRTGTTSETPVFDKAITLIAVGGLVVIRP